MIDKSPGKGKKNKDNNVQRIFGDDKFKKSLRRVDFCLGIIIFLHKL